MKQEKGFLNKLNELENELKNEINNLKNKIYNLEQQNKGQLNQEINEDDLYYFYIVSDSLKIDYFKIGITNNIKSRLSSIQTGNHNKVYLIDFLVDNKNNIVQLEKILKERMSNYNLSGEWFQLGDKDRMELFNWLNEVKLNKNKLNNILGLNVQKQNNDNETIKFENNKIKLSELKINEIIELLKKYLKNVDGKLMFINNLTNDLSFDYEYLLNYIEINENIINDLNNKKFNNIFEKMNDEYLCCFEEINQEERNNFNKYKTEYTSEIQFLLDKIGIESLDGLINMPFINIYDFYVKECHGKLSKDKLISEFEMFGYTLGRLNKYSRLKNNKKITCSKALLSNDNKKITMPSKN